MSRCRIVCEYAVASVGQVDTEVVIVVYIQHTAIGGRIVVKINVDEVNVMLAYCPVEYMALPPAI